MDEMPFADDPGRPEPAEDDWAFAAALCADGHDAVLLLDAASGRVLLANPAFERLTGHAPESLRDRPFDAIGLWVDPAVSDRLAATRADGRPLVVDAAVLRHRDGQALRVRLGASVFRGRSGRRCQAIHLLDVTRDEQVQAEYRATLDTALIGIAYARMRPTARFFVHCNPSFEAMFGWAPGTMSGQPTSCLWPRRADYEAARAVVDGPLLRGEAIDIERQLCRRDGSLFICRLRARAVPGRPGEEAGTIYLCEDVTERRRVDDALAAALQQAEAANRAKDVFLANMSHEIRTPMNAILGMSRLALKSGLEPRQRHYVERVERSATLLMQLVDDLFEFTRIEASMLSLDLRLFELHELFDTVAALVGGDAQAKGIELLFDEPADLPAVLVGDAQRLGEVLVKLAGNAVKFTERGEVIVGVEACDAPAAPGAADPADASTIALRFFVADTGIGIDEAQSRRLFEPFVQADGSAARRFGGTGLGLAICQRLVALMGGTIDLQSTPGRGSRFSVELRLDRVPGAADPPPRLRAPDDPPWRALVVEAHPIAARLLCTLLGRLGVDAESVADGWDAMRRVAMAPADERPALLLIASELPGMDGGMDGVECTRELAALFADAPVGVTAAEAAAAPAFVLSHAGARDEIERRLAAAGLAGVPLLARPVTLGALHAACGAALRRAAGEAPVAGAVTAPGGGPPSAESLPLPLAGLRILLVEDNPINRELALELLTDAGAQVRLAGDGVEALAALRERACDAVLMDCQMPVMDGYAATRAIRSEARWRDLPVIALTANARPGDRERALEAGMNDHIAKPIDGDVMLATLLRWVPHAASR